MNRLYAHSSVIVVFISLSLEYIHYSQYHLTERLLEMVMVRKPKKTRQIWGIW